jgi:sugar-specific transcriptional regulator TrmB/DNA-binding CsgD family transcriptional regulator
VLAALGLTERDEIVYQYLVGVPPATMTEVANGTGLHPDQVREALYDLEEKGFAHPVAADAAGPGGHGRFIAASPATVGTAISARLADLQRDQESLSALAARYNARHLAADGAGVFEVIRGIDALRERTLDMVTSAQSEALNMVKPPVVAVQATEAVEPDARVRGRVVFDRDVVADTKNLDAIRNRPGTHYEVRVHTMVPVKMLAVDRAMALVPLAQHGDVPVGVLIFKSALLDSFLALFDYVWETATGLHVNGQDDLQVRPPIAAEQRPSSLPQPDRQLLSLLLAGLTDQAIATHLTISVRTVERKVRALMDAAHVRTRMQLAWEASRQGWL